MQPAVFGATGRTGVPLVEQALERGHSVMAHTRPPEKLAIEHERVDIVVGDAYTEECVRETVARADVATCILDIVDDGLYIRELPKGGPS